jgi:hypothetical protein
MTNSYRSLLRSQHVQLDSWLSEFRRLTHVTDNRLEILLCNPTVRGSNIDPEIGYPDRDISWLSSVPPDKCQDDIPQGHDRFLPRPSNSLGPALLAFWAAWKQWLALGKVLSRALPLYLLFP